MRGWEPTSLVLPAVLLGQGELPLDAVFQVVLLLAQHLLGLPESGQGLLGAGGPTALRRAPSFKEPAQLAHGCAVGGVLGGTGERDRPPLSGADPQRRRPWESTSRRGR